jgi:hypothetical protein
LIEGNSIRSTERLTGVHRDTVMRLLVQAGDGAHALLDGKRPIENVLDNSSRLISA